ncbi:MAG: hypothetical protein Q7R35_13200, partial [Elusimicrobiota bacterium]|nr:hypothetical protein [Elusimicrobiota bacterium]
MRHFPATSRLVKIWIFFIFSAFVGYAGMQVFAASNKAAGVPEVKTSSVPAQPQASTAIAEQIEKMKREHAPSSPATRAVSFLGLFA